MNVFPLVFLLCIDIVMQSMKRNGLLGMSIRYCDPTVSQYEANLFFAFLLVVGTFMMQMV